MDCNQEKDNLAEERGAFDCQIVERINNGHVPDLRCNQRNEWFYNNVWRDPEYVKMSFLENINFLEKSLKRKSKVLEVGCGPGHNSLELARNGHDVIGIDLSPECIDVARKTLAKNTYHDGFGSLKYHAGDFLKMKLSEKTFDAILFYGSLSHFPNLDNALDCVCKLLVPSGTVLIWDTNVDLYSEKDATILYLIRSILALTGHYYRKEELPRDESSLRERIKCALNELKYIDENCTNVQSPNDNAFSYQTMVSALGKRFEKVILTPESCFYRNMIGGIRFEQPGDEHIMASFIKLVENHMIKNGMLNPAFFYYVGKKR